MDAAVLAADGTLWLVDVWWAADVPRRRAASNRLERLFDGHAVVAANPLERLDALEQLLAPAREGGTAPALRKLLLAPFVPERELERCREAWPSGRFTLSVGAWPRELPVSGTPPKPPRVQAARHAFERLARRPAEALESPELRNDWAAVRRDLGAFLRRRGAADAAAGLEEKWQAVAGEPLRVALFGTFSSGKTTLVNALTGPHLFPVKDVPTTATRVDIRSGSPVRGEVRYHDAGHLDEVRAAVAEKPGLLPKGLSIGDLRSDDPRLGTRRTCPDWETLNRTIQDTTGSVFVKSVDVQLPIDELRGLQLIDLPGTDSPFPWHTRVTRGVLDEVDVGIYLFEATRAFGEKDADLLSLIGTRRNLSDATRFLFLVNAIDGVRPAERPAVVARVEGELHRRFGIERARVVPTSLYLAEARHRLGGDDPERRARRLAYVLQGLGLDPRTPADQAVAHSGLSEVRAFLEQVRDEKRLWKARAWLETAHAHARGLLGAAEREQAALAATAERVVEVRRTLEAKVKEAEGLLRDHVNQARLAAREAIDAAADPHLLQMRWHAVGEAFRGSRDETEAGIKRASQEWCTEAGRAVIDAVQELQVSAAGRAQQLLGALSDGTERALRVLAADGGEVDLPATFGALEVDWLGAPAGSGDRHVLHELAHVFYAAAKTVDFGRGFLAELSAGIVSVVSNVAGALLDGVGHVLQSIWSWLTGERRDPRAEAVAHLKAQLTLDKAKVQAAPLLDEGRRRTDAIVMEVLRHFAGRTRALQDELAAAQRRAGEDERSLAARRADVERAITEGRELCARIASLRNAL